MWIIYSLTVGFSCGVGNFFLGAKLGHLGAMGAGFTGPLPLLILLVFRAYTFIQTKRMTGNLVDKDNSNYWRKNQTGDNIFQYKNLIPLAGNFIPNLLGLVCMSLMLMYAGEAGIN